MAEKDRNRIKDKVMQNRDRIAVILSVLYLCFLALSVIIIIRILHIQHSEINPVIAEDFRPKSSKHIEVPVRGAIIAEDGRLLAISTPMYQIYMDCSVQKDEYSADQVNGDAKEKAWRRCADSLSHSLSTFYKDKTPKEYYDLIITSRNKGSRFVKIGGQIDHEQLQNVKRFPLFNKDANVGGMLIFKRETRQYPYGTLARRCIGYVKDNSNSNGNNHIGLEGKYDYVLHGKEGYEWLRVSDNRSRIQNYDSTYVKAEDGMDVRTTLNIDIQDIADRALRAQIADKPEIEGGVRDHSGREDRSRESHGQPDQGLH
jgi:cell division protein FtsI (penicillin-binding protein 3)